jgi:hypothetical protein
MIKFTEKLCVCYTCCGPTYRKSAMERLTKDCFSHPNLYYSILTDDKSYFKDVKLDNFVVHELKDYYNDYPDLERNESFLESIDEKDYGEKFVRQDYKFSFSTYRFHLIEAKKFDICNVALLSTDIKLNFDFISDELFRDKNSIESLLPEYRLIRSNSERTRDTVEIIQRKYNLTANDEIKEYDSAGRLFVFQDIEFMEMFFNMWDDVVNTLYRENKIWASTGTYAIHDEFLLSVIFDVIGIHNQKMTTSGQLYHYYEISKFERFWTYPPLTKTSGKFIIAITGPLLKYRLAILKDACPNAKDYLLFLTDKESYQMYKEYHHFFDFVIMDDYREKYPFSLKYEVFPDFKTEEEFLKNISTFYGESTGNYYPYSISRFIFPYLMENNILNFSIICSDTILSNDADFLKSFFDSIPVGCCYSPDMGIDNHYIDIKMNFWKESIQPLFPQIKLDTPFMRACDGYLRGFHFRNKEDMKLFFDLWNTSTEHIFTIQNYRELGSNNGLISEQEWISGHIIGFFEHQLNYIFKDAIDLTEIKGKKCMYHCSRPDDTFYMNSRKGTWPQFDYSDRTSISSFIKNNKKELHKYYDGQPFQHEVTDNYVYTRLL